MFVLFRNIIILSNVNSKYIYNDKIDYVGFIFKILFKKILVPKYRLENTALVFTVF